MTRAMNLSSFYRNTIGFDQLYNLMVSTLPDSEANTYPRYNIERLSDDEYRLTLAIAGYTLDDLSIELKEGRLQIDGRKYDQEEEGVEVIHKGISSKSFRQSFALGPHVKVEKAELDLGLLKIALKREIPPELLPQKIPIQGSK